MPCSACTAYGSRTCWNLNSGWFLSETEESFECWKFEKKGEVNKMIVVDLTKDKRKLNDVFTVPLTIGYITIKGIIGSGKTKEEVVLKAKSDINSTDVIDWRHHIGEQWKVVEHFTESEK